ncbi:prepilin peptidase [Staphylococcus canis]|uniref:Prepilin peptidase n=1 Tax=Staphylococcus canis TaxID=2724942 RepID=A0ABS0T626_9STAP|nr:A24 family peptidase [Staphylococcus canis]MBI5974192.1 prepilin peptidase [Staphylococcus canis]
MIVVILMFGASLMSFLMQVSEHKVLKISMLWNRSRCQKCYHTIACYDLIPIFSFLILKGRCRHCGTTIPLQLFIAELLGAFLLILPIYLALDIYLSYFYLISLILLTLSFIDIQDLIVPHRWLLLLVFCLVGLGMFNHITISQLLLSAVLLVFGMIFPNFIGFGDIKLLMILALALPFNFMVLLLLILFPIALLLLPFYYLFKLVHFPIIPLVPSIFLSFIIISIMFKQFLFYFGGIL